jgi:hypothetical protein
MQGDLRVPGPMRRMLLSLLLLSRSLSGLEVEVFPLFLFETFDESLRQVDSVLIHLEDFVYCARLLLVERALW